MTMAKSRRVLAHNYKDQGQHAKAITLYKWTEKASQEQHEYREQALALMNLGQVYLNMNKLDSALMYSQRAYEYLLQHDTEDYSPAVLTDIAQIHSKLGNKDLAESYFKMSIERGQRQGNMRFLNLALSRLAKHHYENQQLDSATLYAKRAIATVQKTAYSNFAMEPAQLLSKIYENSNNDSTLKYLKIYIAANDSLYSAKNIQQTQTLTFENELKQQEIEASKEREKQQRNLNLQFALIGFGIISFIIIFLLLSRSIITNTRLISFLGVVALLIVFEFMNLLLHPFLERVTHHNPVLMLLGLVCIAALLVPLHHRLEKWATAKLVEKNKQIRLAEAKRTIEKLESVNHQNSSKR
jgi:tetratricopeptide (TPR) repeat protein